MLLYVAAAAVDFLPTLEFVWVVKVRYRFWGVSADWLQKLEQFICLQYWVKGVRQTDKTLLSTFGLVEINTLGEPRELRETDQFGLVKASWGLMYRF